MTSIPTGFSPKKKKTNKPKHLKLSILLDNRLPSAMSRQGKSMGVVYLQFSKAVSIISHGKLMVKCRRKRGQNWMINCKKFSGTLGLENDVQWYKWQLFLVATLKVNCWGKNWIMSLLITWMMGQCITTYQSPGVDTWRVCCCVKGHRLGKGVDRKFHRGTWRGNITFVNWQLMAWD